MAVADHDFTKASVISSVAMICNIPSDVTGSFYARQVHVGIKYAIFEPSSPLRHATELNGIFNSIDDTHLILMLYTDGGPDHCLTYHSWRNPVERIMSILNLALQLVGLMRTKMDQKFEQAMSKCKSMEDVRQQVEALPGFRDAFIDSIEPVKVLL